MEEMLTQLGLNDKEAKFYLFLIEKGDMTAAQLAKELGESRTNMYMVLEKLAERGLVVADDTTSVRKYSAADPEKLKNLIAAKQIQLRQASRALSVVLPELSAQYNLGQHKPGVVYLEGIAGYKKSLDDMAKSGQLVCVLASDVAPENKEAWEMLENYAFRRKEKGGHSRMIFSTKIKKEINVEKFSAKGYEIRFWGAELREGEIVMYGNKVALTVYQPALIVTVITNDVLAATFRVLFEQMWADAESVRG